MPDRSLPDQCGSSTATPKSIGYVAQRNRGRVALTTGPTASGTEVRMHAEPTERKPLSRAKPGIDGERRYHHPNGYVIRREVRDWDARSTGPGGRSGNDGPKVSWVVHRSFTSPRRWLESFDTLRAARAWCDEHDPAALDEERPGEQVQCPTCGYMAMREWEVCTKCCSPLDSDAPREEHRG
jgi:hypothetical protein